MKKISSIMIVVLCSTLSVFAEQITVKDLALKPGESAMVEIALQNANTNLVAFQMDLALPDGIGIEKNGCSLSSRITDEDQTLTVGKLSEGLYRLTSTSLSLKPISGTSGTLLTLKLTSSGGFMNGNATISNILFSTAASEEVAMDDVSFTINTLYNLTYMVDGEEYKTSIAAYGTTITPEAEPTKEGYTFSGWSEIPETMPAHDVTVTGSFNVNKYKLTYMVDGEEYKSYDIEYGATITPEAAPTKEGYTFSGWSVIPEKMPARDVTVTSTFTINKYKLVYKVDGEEYKTYDVEYGAVITPEAVPMKEGYTFSGWSEIPEKMPARDVTVTGTFTINKYKLVYKVDDVDYKSYEIEYSAAISAEAEPVKEGYSFSGWSLIPETMPAHDVIVTGTFTKGAYKLIYVVDGATYKTISYDYAVAITPEAVPTKEGYTFSGWSEIPETMPAKDVTVTGTFTINKYKLVYKVDDVDYKSYEIEFAAAVSAEAEPVKEGYSFSGWSLIPETMPAHDVTVNGSFTINNYKLVYKVDGVTYKTVSCDYAVAITPEPAPTKEGYTFSGWSEIPETMPAKDVTVTGTFTINKYKLVYKVDGEEYKTYDVEYGAVITPEAVPMKEGYTFSGWSEIPETMPAHDVTVTGSFNVNKYKLTYMVDGEEYKSYDIEYGATITPEAAPTKEGYTFSGWSVIPEKMPAHNVTITGSFTKGAYKLIYVVDGETYKTISYDYGDDITPEATPTKEGHTFSGWSEIPETMPAYDVVVTGTFSVNSYTVTFMYGESILSVISVEYGAEIPLPESLNSERYTLIEWLDVPETMPAHDIVIYADYVDDINPVADDKTYAIYDEKGIRNPRLKRGVNILRISDGTIRKMMVK